MKKLVVALLVAVAVSVPGTAYAHDPVFITDQAAGTPGPLIEDGTISFAVYGVISKPAENATFRVRLAAGQQLSVELLVPDKPPENTLPDNSHLQVTIATPDGKITDLPVGPVLDKFDEPFTKTSYLRLLAYETPAVAGVSTLTVTSARPTRFTVATGKTETFGTAVSDYQRVGLDALTTWYQTPPPEAPATPAGTAVAATPAPGPTTTPVPSPGPEAARATEGVTRSDGQSSGPAVIAVVLGLVAVAVAAAAVLLLGGRRGADRSPPS